MSTVSGVNSGSQTADPASANSKQAGIDSLANSQTFMTLLVAQLKNQDPTQPQDGMQFVTQLAQFSNLEQSVAMRTDIGSIKEKYVNAGAAATPASGSSAA